MAGYMHTNVICCSDRYTSEVHVHFSPILKDWDDHDRTKGLLFGSEHVILNVGEDGWLHEETYRK